MTNPYEVRQSARRARLEDLASKNARLSAEQFAASRSATEHIPFGQPILLDHYSAKRHRAALKRGTQAMQRSCDAAEKAEHFARRAASVGKGGISSDDPEAIAKLRAELVSMDLAQQRMKQVNLVLRSRSGDEGAQIAGLLALDWMTDEHAHELVREDFAGDVGFARYKLTNNGANMRRVERRIKELEAAQARASKEAVCSGYIYREDPAENRVMFIFECKPDEATRRLLKDQGFKWSPSREGKPWVRQLTSAGLYNARMVRALLDAASDAAASD